MTTITLQSLAGGEAELLLHLQARRVLLVTLVLNLLVSTVELGWGFHTHTLSLASRS